MAQKKTNEELEKLSKRELFQYLDDITQTPICKDKNHCEKLLEIIKKA